MWARAAALATMVVTGACQAQSSGGAPAAGPAAPVAPATTAAESAPAPTPETGRNVYTSFCTRCHGINLQVSSSAFFDLRTFPQADKERFVTSVMKGKRAMPAWEGLIKPAELEALWVYIGSVNGGK